MSLIPVILCGGAGSRLWPVSREMHPKPFIRLSDGESLLQKAFLRGVQLKNVQKILTVTNREFFFKTEDEFRSINRTQCFTSFILEPVGRNTAAAIAAAALTLAEETPNSILLVLAADHIITHADAFAQAVEKAQTLAKKDKLVTFGIRPDAPETGYGYIEAEGNSVLRFVEKPNERMAQKYVKSGRFLWNSGMFCFKASTVLKEMRRYCPQILQAVQASLAAADRTHGALSSKCELNPELFAAVPSDSFDYAVMEKSRAVAVVPCDMGWSDIGSWNVLGGLVQEDRNGNRIESEVILHDVSNCHIQSVDRLVGAVGVKDLIIIDTADAILVASKNRAQDVKYIYAELKKSGHDTHKIHRTVHRPWGTYTVLEEGKDFKIKRIVVKPGGTLSLQMHHHRSEHWIVVSGTAKAIVGEEERYIATNESTYIPAGHRHRLINPTNADLIIIEVQSGHYLGEDDIVRFEDNYGRAAAI